MKSKLNKTLLLVMVQGPENLCRIKHMLTIQHPTVNDEYQMEDTCLRSMQRAGYLGIVLTNTHSSGRVVLGTHERPFYQLNLSPRSTISGTIYILSLLHRSMGLM
jgi:hypothetical protein